MLRLLVKHNASVHELSYGRSMTGLNLISSQARPRTLEFFHFLYNECYYLDFNQPVGDSVWSPLTNAIRSGPLALDCLRFLKERAGMDFSRLAAGTSGSYRTVMHLAAEYAGDVAVMDLLFEACGGDSSGYINRQDSHGWSPLHYAIATAYYAWDREVEATGVLSLARIRYLIEQGADPLLKSTSQLDVFCAGKMDEDAFSPLELCKALSSEDNGGREELYKGFVNIIAENGQEFLGFMEKESIRE